MKFKNLHRSFFAFLGLGLLAMPAASAQYIWHQVGTNFTTGFVEVSHIVSATEIYAAGDLGMNSTPTTTGKVMKWNGTTWAALGSFSALYDFSAMRYVVANNIYVGGYNNTTGLNQVLRWNGTAWAAVGALNGNSSITAIDYVSTSEVYAAGYFTNGSGSNYVAKWNGTAWSVLGGALSGAPTSVLKCVSATEIYTVMSLSGSTGMYKWNGTTWTLLGNTFSDLGFQGNVLTMNYVSATEIYIAGTLHNNANSRRVILKWNGTTWVQVGVFPVPTLSDPNVAIREIAYKSANEMYVVGNLESNPGSPPDPEAPYKWDGTNWTQVLPTPFSSNIENMKYHAASNTFYATGSPDYVLPSNLITTSAMYNYAPCLPASTPTITANHTTVCNRQPVTLTATGALNDETAWVWYSGSCSGTLLGTGASITVNPTVTTTYYARGEGSCNSSGSCGSITINASADSRIYVKANATGLNNGTSWANAYTSLQSALDQTTTCDSIFVAAGTYIPTKDVAGTVTTGRTRTFKIPSDVKVFGGFVGNETQLAQRPIIGFSGSAAILSGEIATAALTDNVYHVVTFVNASAATELDGFIIEKGYANGAAASIYDRGGGILNNGSGASNYSAPNIERCLIRNNFATTSGGGMMDYGITGGEVQSAVWNCIFTGNSAAIGGGYHGLGKGTTSGFCSSQISNALFYANTATNDGGGAYFSNLTGASGAVSGLTGPAIYFSTFVNNTIGATKKGRGAYLLEGYLYAYNSLSWHGAAQSEIDHAATNNTLYFNNTFTTVDPLFVNAASNDYRLTKCSPALNIITTHYASSESTTDLDGNPRRYANGNTDLGCYERQTGASTTKIYVKANATGLNNGTSWTNAYTNLQAALDVACGDTIWVANGTYYPTKDATGNSAPTDARTKTFKIPTNSVVYGGFVGNETALSQRALPTASLSVSATGVSATVLSGDIGVLNTTTDNTYHVVSLQDVREPL
jgi:Ig-like domain CHU_C associated